MRGSTIASAVSGLRSHCAECFCLAWTAGLLAAFFGYPFIAAVGAGICVLAGIAVKLPKLRRFRKNTLPLVLMAMGMLSGLTVWQHYDRTVRQPLCAMDGETVTLTGTVTNLSRNADERTVYSLRTVLCGSRVSVDWYAGEGDLLRIGDAVTLNAVLTRITEDYASHTASVQAGMGKYLRIYKADILDIAEDTGFSFSRAVHAYRVRISQEITHRLSPDAAALMNGMLFGDKTALSDDARDALYAAGIGHITAVSGLHLVFFSAMVMALLRLLCIPARLRFLLNCGAIGLFMMLADGSASVRRAALMLILSRSAVLFGRKINTMHGLCLAMFFSTLFTPYVIGAAGFWLSVSGVLGIGVIAPYMAGAFPFRGFAKRILPLCCVSAAVFPASVLLLGQGSLIAPLSNLFILPLGIAALYIGLITVCTGGLTAFLLPLAEPFCRALLTAAEYAAKIPFSHITVSAEPVRITLIAITALLLILLAAHVSGTHVLSAFFACCLLLLGQIVYGSLSAEQMLQIAVLGKEKDTAAVILCDGEAYLAEFGGTSRTPRYVSRFLEEHAADGVQMLICSGQKRADAYQAQRIRAEHVYDLSTGISVSADRGALSLRAESGRLHLVWNGITADILPAFDESPAEAQIIVRYGGKPLAEDRFVWRLSPAISAELCTAPEYGGQNMLIRITKDGHGDIKPLK